MRSILKRALMDAYCAGIVPAWCVRTAFRVFKLEVV